MTMDDDDSHVDLKMREPALVGRTCIRKIGTVPGTPRGRGIVKATAETTEMRRLVGKVALLIAFVYVLVLFGGVITLVQATSVNVITWPLLILPAAAFVPSVIDAVHLHRTSDPDRMKTLWRRCGLYALIGLGLLIVAAVILNQVN
jgi:hypothetical protein